VQKCVEGLLRAFLQEALEVKGVFNLKHAVPTQCKTIIRSPDDLEKFPITDENDKAAVFELLATNLHHNYGRVLENDIRVFTLYPSVCIPAQYLFAYTLTDNASAAMIKTTVKLHDINRVNEDLRQPAAPDSTKALWQLAMLPN
jgi:hypothetical protein